MLTPGYPGIGQGEAGLRALRGNPDVVAGVGVREVMDYLTEYIGKLDVRPVIMGHSFGGTFAQLLVGNGLGSAGVSINGAGVKGIKACPSPSYAPPSPVLDNPANSKRAVSLTPEQFHYAFTNTLTRKCPGRPTTGTRHPRRPDPVPGRPRRRHPRRATTFDFANDDRAPLLFISGGSDHILPPVVQRENYEKNVKHSIAVTGHKVFHGRDHFTCGEPGWEAVADFALDWALAPVPGVLDSHGSPGLECG